MRVIDVRAEHHRGRPLGVGQSRPRLSWITDTDAPGWWQAAYEIEIDGNSAGRVESDRSVFAPWPGTPLASRGQAVVRVRTWGTDGSESDWSEPLEIEAGLLEAGDWVAEWISPVTRDPLDVSSPAPFLRRSFQLAGAVVVRARLYVTSAGIHHVHLNGVVVGDHLLAPGWSSYTHRLRYDTHDVTDLVRAGENVLGAIVADGWWRGHLGWDMLRNRYGDRLGLLAQLEVDLADGTRVVVVSDDDWSTQTGPILSSDLYNGETYDARADLDAWDQAGYDDSGWCPVERFAPAVGELVAPPGPPVRRTQLVPVAEVITSPSGRTIFDFGQNLVGRLRFTIDAPAGTTVVLRHAEVLEDGELAVGPLRNAKATDTYIADGRGPATWEPRFTFHGFRYAEVEGWSGVIDPACFHAVVVHSDMQRTGTFTCDHPLLDQLHRNVVWGMRGNFVDVPTDCPQRDERLGWTGDLQVFAPAAAYLYDVSGMLGNWLDDLAADQRADGSVPVFVPTLEPMLPLLAAGWSDAVTVVPTELAYAYDDLGMLERHYESMRRWVDYVDGAAGPKRLWLHGFQFGDWLDPDAPERKPYKAKTDARLVASAYFALSTQLVADAATLLGHHADADRYGALAEEIRAAFRDEYLTPRGRLMSDTATAYALALRFGLISDDDARRRVAASLARSVKESFYTISSGFLGTPQVLAALSDAGDELSAYRLLTQTGLPSWLYPVTMGATTIWERWDSLLPDGSVNGTGMTSFNHYAFGAVADWMHRHIGGLAPLERGYRTLLVAPLPGPGVTSARASLRTPYGTAECEWSLAGTDVSLRVLVPPNTTAVVVRPGVTDDRQNPVRVAAGRHEWGYDVGRETVVAWSDPEWQAMFE